MTKFKVGMTVRIRDNVTDEEKKGDIVEWVRGMDRFAGKRYEIIDVRNNGCVYLSCGYTWHLNWIERPCRLSRGRK